MDIWTQGTGNDTYTIRCVKQRVSGKLPYGTRSSARRSLMTWSGGLRGGGGKEVQEGGDICIHIADSPHCTAEKKTQRCKATIPPIKRKAAPIS